MSLLGKLKDSILGLKGADLEKRDGKVSSNIKADSALSMKGKTPSPRYSDEISAADAAARVNL